MTVWPKVKTLGGGLGMRRPHQPTRGAGSSFIRSKFTWKYIILPRFHKNNPFKALETFYLSTWWDVVLKIYSNTEEAKLNNCPKFHQFISKQLEAKYNDMCPYENSKCATKIVLENDKNVVFPSTFHTVELKCIFFLNISTIIDLS